MADFKSPGLRIEVEFERNDIYEGNNFSKGPHPKRDTKVIRVQFDLVSPLVTREKVFLEIFIFGTALKSGPVETIPTGLVATALIYAGRMSCT